MISLSLFRLEDQHEIFAAGQRIFGVGDSGQSMYVVYEGAVTVFVQGRPVERLGPGNVFGEMALIDHQPRSADVVAETDVKLVSIDERRFMFLVQQTPNFALQLMRIMAERLRRAGGTP